MSKKGLRAEIAAYMNDIRGLPTHSNERNFEVAACLDKARDHYRHALLQSCSGKYMLELLERTNSGKLAFSKVLDDRVTHGLGAEQIRANLPGSVQEMRALWTEIEVTMQSLLRARTDSSRTEHQCQLRKHRLAFAREGAKVPVELIGPHSRRENTLYQRAVEAAARAAFLNGKIAQQTGRGWDDQSGVDRQKKRRAAPTITELHQHCLDTGQTPDELVSMAEILRCRRAHFDGVRREFIEGNLPYVVRIAATYARKGVLFSDLVEQGNRGLIRAVDMYEHKMGTVFTTYATAKIRAKMLEALRGQYAFRSSLNDPVGCDEKTDYASLIPDDEEVVNPAQMRSLSLRSELLLTLIDSLESEMQRTVLRLAYGYEDGYAYSGSEIAVLLGRDRRNIFQIHRRGIEQLQIYMRDEGLQMHDWLGVDKILRFKAS